MKIIIIDHEPYRPSRGSAFFEDQFVNDNYEFEYWSLWKLFPYSKNLNYNYSYENEHVSYLTNWFDVEKRITKLDAQNTFVVVECWFNSHTWKLFHCLQKEQIRWGRIDYYRNPVDNFYYNKEIDTPEESSKMKVIQVEKGRIKNLWGNFLDINYLQYHFLKRLNFDYLRKIMRPGLVIQAGSFMMNPFLNTKYAFVNYFDVEIYNSTVVEDPILDYDYIVFGDIFLGRHPDLQINHGNDYMDVQQYYKFLDDFFSKIESIYGMPVVIAAHPKSDYKEEFGHRIVIKDKSANLIINSKLYMHHGSLSITYAMLAKKPIIQFYNNKFLESEALLKFVRVMKNIEKQLGVLTINADKTSDFQVASVDVGKYNAALDNFFRSDVKDKNNYEIVKEEINSLFELDRSRC